MEQSKFYQIKNITEHEYTLVGCDGSIITRPIRDIDKSASAFTIQDAKDGDVLATLGYILIFKTTLKNNGGVSYCHYDFTANTPHFNWNEDINWYFGKKAIVHPATKEQRDILFARMKEAEYEWDAEKKELKKIEQTTTNNQFTPEQASVLDKHIDKFFGQKPSWSEEDSLQLAAAINIVTNSGHTCTSDWLKSLKDRVQSQPKQEWSEEDKNLREATIGLLNLVQPLDAKSWGKSRLDCIDWLKSLRPQNRWKPSDKQLNVLEFYIPYVTECSFVLQKSKDTLLSLLADLKKLREE